MGVFCKKVDLSSTQGALCTVSVFFTFYLFGGTQRTLCLRAWEEEGKGGEGKGGEERERNGGHPQRAGSHPYVPNPEKYPGAAVVLFKLRLKTFLFSQAFSSFSAH